MNKLKKTAAVIAAAVMTAAAAGVNALADDEFTYSSDDSRYKYIEEADAAATIAVSQRSKTGFSGALDIPKLIDGLTVTGIYDSGFSGSEITSVKVPDSVTKVGSLAFSNCFLLTEAELPENITSMGTTVFSQTPYESALLKNAEGSGFAVINGYILYLYTGNESAITVPEGVTVVAGSAFANDGVNSNTQIKSVKLPETTEYICSNAFDNCKSLQKVVVGNSIKGIEDGAFGSSFKGSIYCYAGSAAEKYAKANNLKYITINADGLVLGDANKDGYVNVLDASFIAKLIAAAKKDQLPQEADFNEDNNINVGDASGIAKFLASGRR